MPSAKDVDALIARIDELNRNVQKLSGKAPAAKTATKAAAKPAAKKARPPSARPRASRLKHCELHQKGTHRPFFYACACLFARLLQSSNYFRGRRLHFLSMTSAKRSKSKPSIQSKPRIALALAGGGPLGAIYEIGALCALDESLQGISFTQLHHYVGVSAGGFIAAGLANGMTPRELCAAFIDNGDQASEVFDPAWLMVPAYGEFLRRGITPARPARLGRVARHLWAQVFCPCAGGAGAGLAHGYFFQ